MLSKGLHLIQPAPIDNPWRRLSWTLPIALLIWILGLWGVGLYLENPGQLPSEVKPIEAQFIELPAPVTIQTTPAKRPLPRPQPPPPLPEPVPLLTEPVQPVPKAIPEPEVQAPEAQTAAPPTQPTPSIPAPSTTPLPGAGQGARAIYHPRPNIPDDLREDALDAIAVARFHVAADGTVTVELITPTPNPRLNQVLLDTLKTWRFFPAMKNGIPVASTQDLRISVEVR